MGEEAKDAEAAVPETGEEVSETPSGGGLRQLFAKKEAVLAMGGAVLAIGLGVALMAWPGDAPSDEESAEEQEKPQVEPKVEKPKARPRKQVVDDAAKSVFTRAEDALATGKAESAREILEEGLSNTPVGEAGLRSQFFQRLAQVAAHLGREEAARIYERSGERLGKVEEQARALMEEGFAALAAGDPRTARQRLYQFILRSEDVKEGGAVLKGLAWRTITRAWFEEFTASGGLKKAGLEEPVFGFERSQR